jgi:hypothetical protein
MSPEEYKALGKTYTSELFNFRGNKQAAKALVKRVQDENKFDNEGQALDYIFTAFENIPDVSGFHEHEQNLKEEIYRLQNEVTTLNRENTILLEVKNKPVFSSEFKQSIGKIGEDVQAVLNAELGDKAPSVTTSDIAHMIVEFAQADPAAAVESILEKNNALTPDLGEAVNALQFPLTSTLQKLYPTIFNQSSNGGTEQTAGAGTNSGAANQESNS